MAYCGPNAIPYTEFMGGPPGWDDMSRSAALAWRRGENARCHGCGTTLDEWHARDEDGNIAVDAKGNPKMAVPLPKLVETTECPGCWAVAVARADGMSSEVDPAAFKHHHFVDNPSAD